MLFGHLIRMDESADARRILTAVPQSDWRRPVGRPHSSWMATLKNDLLCTTSPLRMLSKWPWISRCGDYWQQAELRTDGAYRIMMMMMLFWWQVLTSKWCSEEGLEDATNLLLQLSKTNSELQELVLKLLLVGARELGLTVCEHIRSATSAFLTLLRIMYMASLCWEYSFLN